MSKISIGEAMKRLHLTRKTLYEWGKTGKIKEYRAADAYQTRYYDVDEVEKIRKEREPK